MNSDDYLPRVLEDDSQPEIPVPSDASKWAAVHDVLENTTSNTVSFRSGTGSLFTVAWVLGLTLGLVWVWRNGRTVFEQWQENVHRRANRRRHGIPDEDDRPFNVAYAAAALARKQREAEEKGKPKTPRRHYLPSGSESERREGSVSLRQRPLRADFGSASSGENVQPMFVQGNSANSSSAQEGEFVAQSSAHPASPAIEPHDRSDPYNPNRGPELDARPAAQGPQSGPSGAGANSRTLPGGNEGDRSFPERRKHHHVDDDDEDRTSKRTRVDGEEFIDGDNDAPWMPGGSRRTSLQVPKRGSKRHANHEDEGDWEMSQDKRARKGSLAMPESNAKGDNDVDMALESSDAELQPTRGTKREREELESVADDAAENLDESHRPQPLRKRRANGKARADEPSSRGRKRDRSPEMPTSSDEGDESDTQATRHKRGRRDKEQVEDAEMASASESDDMPDFTEDPACGGRRIGEVWEVNGQSFKVGLDGRRLRHALVKQQRSRFPMPKDSAHNDARTNVDVVVEKWLNDEEYKAAKERFELAWQDPSPASTPLKAEVTIEDEHPSSAGKRLLWEGPPSSPVKGRASISSLSNIRNPFDLAPSNVGRRVASAHLLMNNPGESPKLRSSKSFSKWEKQDMEANSLKKMRARLDKEKKDKDKEKEKEKEKTKSFLPPTPTTSTPLAPTTNKPTQETKLTPAHAPAAAAAQGTKITSPAAPSPFVQPASSNPAGSVPNFFAKPATTAATAALVTTTQPSTTSLFPTSTQTATSSPSTMAPTAAKASFTFGPALTSTSTPSSEANKGVASKPSISFGSTSLTPTSTPATTGASKPSFNLSAPPAQANTGDAPKIPAFSFANAHTSSVTSSEQGKAATSNPFAKPASQPVSTPSFAPTGNSPFSFNQSAQPSQAATQKQSTFQFASTAQTNNPGTPSGPGPNPGSLLSRLGPAPALSQPSQATTTTQNTWSSPFGAGPTASATSTNTPNTNPPSTSSFGQTQSQSQPQQVSKNLFESANKPSPFAPSGPSQNTFGQTPSTSATPPAFSFAKPPGTSDASKVAASSVFGKPSGQSEVPSTSQAAAPSIFGKPSGQSEAPASQPAPPSIFGKPSGQSEAPASQSATLSVFGKPSGQSEAAQSIFGKPSGQSEAPASQPVAPSIFGKPSMQPEASALKPAASVFGKPSGQPEATQSIFGKPSGQSEAPASQPPATSIFGKPSMQPEASALKPAASVFGKPSGQPEVTQSIFGKPSGQSEAPASQPAAPSIFGKPSGQPEASASQSKPSFSFDFGNSPAAPSNVNPFQPQAPSTDAQATPAAPNAFFGFGQPSSSTTTSGTNAFGFTNKPTEGEKK